MKRLLPSVMLFLAGCVDLAGANAAFCAQRPEVCGATDASTPAEDAGVDAGGPDAGSDAGAPEVLGCDAPGLVAWWTFDEDAGTTLADCSVNALHAQVSGTPYRVAGQHGGAFSFNGLNAAEVGNGPALRLTGAMSVSAWVRLTSFAGSGRLISKSGSDPGWELWADSAQSRLAFTVAQSPLSSFTVGAPVPLGQWVHVAATFAPGGALSFYVDGALINSIPGPATNFDTDAGVRLGNRPDGCCAFVGLVDDLRVFARELGPPQVTELAR